jgi:hypothetical protein
MEQIRGREERGGRGEGRGERGVTAVWCETLKDGLLEGHVEESAPCTTKEHFVAVWLLKKHARQNATRKHTRTRAQREERQEPRVRNKGNSCALSQHLRQWPERDPLQRRNGHPMPQHTMSLFAVRRGRLHPGCFADAQLRRNSAIPVCFTWAEEKRRPSLLPARVWADRQLNGAERADAQTG